MKTIAKKFNAVFPFAILLLWQLSASAEPQHLYGIHDADPDPREYLNHIRPIVGGGWVTATVAVGADTNDNSGQNFSFLSNEGHTVICRINHAYFPNGTIPLASKYDDFAKRCANFVANSQGCSIWVIGNELNIAGEWPFDGTKFAYVAPTNYAACFRKVYDAIKAVRPNDRVLPAAPAPFSGPFSAGTLSWNGTNYPSDANPLKWTDYLNQTLTAIRNSGPFDATNSGIALHVYSRGYNCTDIHSIATFTGGAAGLYKSFYCYKDWVNLGIPGTLYSLPLYITECDGYYFWSGGHSENPSAHYESGWMQEVYAEINRHNQSAIVTGKPIFRCVNMYRWCGACDGWNIDNSPYQSQILADLDAAVAKRYRWPTNFEGRIPIGLNFIDPGGGNDDSVYNCTNAGVIPQAAWFNLTAGGNGTLNLGNGASVTWNAPGGTHSLPIGNSPGDFALMQGYLDTTDTSTTTVTVSGLRFPLYDIYVYSAGDNGGSPSETRVAKFVLNSSTTKYLRDDPTALAFDGTFTEANSTSGGASCPAGNYLRFRNVTGGSFTLTAQGEYASGSPAHPRAALNAIQIVPVLRASLETPRLQNNAFEFFINGTENYSYIVLSSTDLANWSAVQTNRAPFTFSESITNAAGRFYRGVAP